jgi:hypothetical protein
LRLGSRGRPERRSRIPVFVILGTFVAADGGTAWLSEWLAADVVYANAVGVGLGAAAGYLDETPERLR